MLRPLVQAVERFSQEGSLVPFGYKDFARSTPIDWVLRLDAQGKLTSLQRTEIHKPRPTRGRSSDVAPYLLVDEACYALGLPEPPRGKKNVQDMKDLARRKHAAFLQLLRACFTHTHDPDVDVIVRYLDSRPDQKAWPQVEPNDVVTFDVARGDLGKYLFERDQVREFWVRHLRDEYVSNQVVGQCAACGQQAPLLVTLPVDVNVLGQICKVTSFDDAAFTHMGKQRTLNAPQCFDCGLKVTQALNHLLKSDLHRVVLVRENRKKRTRNPLRNEVAIFWLKRQQSVRVAEVEVDLEKELLSPLFDTPLPGAEARLTQMEHFLQAPWKGADQALFVPENQFYLAVLSANKARLVVREWIEASLEAIRRHLRAFFDAQRIVGPNGEAPSVFAVRPLIRSLHRDQDDSDADPNLVRTLLRTAFKGSLPPHGLLQAATTRFGKLVLSAQDDERKRAARFHQLHVLAALIKLVLTHGKGENIVNETLHPYQKDPPYLCGRLLATLAEAQRRASRAPLNKTLLDRFYGSVSTAPGSFLPMLVKRAVTDHLPKVRRENRGYTELNGLIQGLAKGIDDGGGFPQTLSLFQQGAFVLGFYQQRAALTFQPERGNTDSTSNEGVPIGTH